MRTTRLAPSTLDGERFDYHDGFSATAARRCYLNELLEGWVEGRGTLRMLYSLAYDGFGEDNVEICSIIGTGKY